MYTRFHQRAAGLLPASLAAAALLLAATWGPLPTAAQTGGTETPSPTASASATEAVEPTLTATAASTTAPTAAVTATVAATATTTAAATAAAQATTPTTATVTVPATVSATVPATPEPAATVTPAPASSGTLTATVRTSAGVRLRVRSGPGSNYPIVTRLSNGQTVTLLGRNASGSWLLVGLAGQSSPQGWVSATYLSTSAAVADLPAANAAPAPAATSAATPAAAAQAVLPSPGPLPGKIAVPVFDADAGIYNIWMVDANGENLRLVVSNASAPALSDDGTLLAYRHWQRDDRGIVVANSDGSNPWRVTDKLEDVLPSFSPDKSKIVFSTYRQGDRLSRIYYVWTDEQNRRAWEWGAGGLFGEDPDWMADGQIAYHTGGETAQLWLMNGDATNQRAFFSVAAPDSVGAISAAPDSSAVAYMRSSGGNWDIYTVNTDGSNPRRLTDDGANDGLPAWSPDGQSIAFVSDRSGQWALWVMDADGGNQRVLALLPGPVDGRVQFEPDYLNHGWLEEQIGWSW